MTPSAFSIIIPHNGNVTEDDPLLPTLASIVDQEGVRIELLIQHGGGLSGLWGKLSRALNLSAKKDQVTLRVIEEPISSTEETLASGVKRATGTWIGFLQPGEQYLPGALSAINTALQSNDEADLLLTGSVTLIANKPVVAPATLPTSNYLTSVQASLPHHSFFCRASLFEEPFMLKPEYQHQMITEWLLRLLHTGKKIKALPMLATVTTHEEKKNASLLPKATGMTAFLKPWHQWRHQGAMRQAQKHITLPSSISIYQKSSLLQRASLS